MKGKKGISIILSVFMFLTIILNGSLIKLSAVSPEKDSSLRSGNVIITSESELDAYFPDPIFKAAVFNAVKGGKDNAKGIDIKDALANFEGEIHASGKNKSPDKKIKDITGIYLLRKVNSVDLSYNEIIDFSKLGTNAQSGLNPEEFKRYYGFENSINYEDREAGDNVYWNLNGNPFTKLPENFGGRLVIKQPASASYTYPTDSLKYVYFRELAIGPVSGKMNIAKTKIIDTNNVAKNAGLVSVSPIIRKSDGDTDIGLKTKWDKTNFQTTDFEFKTSGQTHIAVGCNQELHYWTQDEFGTITEGTQSFKYYLTPQFDVYDVVQGYSSYGYQAKLTKKDKDTGLPVKGAIYNVYKSNGDLYLGDLETDNNGSIRPVITQKGEYYFQEAVAPEGYLLNDEKISFEIDVDIQEMQWDIIVEGGKREITLKTEDTIGKTRKASEFEKDPTNKYHKATFISATSSPLALSTATDNDAKVIGVHVTFANFLDRFGTEQKNYTRYYDTLKIAQDDINKIVSEHRNYGAIKVVQVAENIDKDIVIEKNTTDTKIYKTSVTVEKKWVDADATIRPKDLKVSLYRNDQDKPIAEAVLNDKNNWSYVFKDLLSSDQYGKEYQFSIKEEVIDGYTLTNNVVTRINNGKDWKFVLTNTSHINPPTPPVVPPTTQVPTVKTNDNTLYMIPLVGLLVSVVAIIFVVKKKKK